MILLDTSIIIDHIRRKTDSVLVRYVSLHPNVAFSLSILSIQELYTGKSTADAQKESMLLATIGSFHLYPYSYEIAQKAGELARDSHENMYFFDCAIAATAIVHSVPVLTLNTKDFSRFPALELA